MTTLAVCGRCGRTEEFGKAQKAGWLIHQIKDQPEGYLIIRCPEHTTGHALRTAGLPQQVTSKKVWDNLERGLWTAYGAPEDGYLASASYYGGGEFGLSYYKGEMPAFQVERFATIKALIVAMRQVEPDLRKWKLAEIE